MFLNTYCSFFFLSVINIYGKHVEFNFLPNVNKEIWTLSILNIWKSENNQLQIVVGIMIFSMSLRRVVEIRRSTKARRAMCNEPK